MKIYLDASAEERARRRAAELLGAKLDPDSAAGMFRAFGPTCTLRHGQSASSARSLERE